MSLLAFFEWLGESPWSIALHESQYAYSIVESIHVWTLCLFFGSVVMFDLRLLGWIMRSVPVSDVVGRLLPWTIAGFVIMVISGSLLFFAIPVAVLSEHFLPDENDPAAARRLERVALPLARLSAGRDLGCLRRAAEARRALPAAFPSCCGAASSFRDG